MFGYDDGFSLKPQVGESFVSFRPRADLAASLLAAGSTPQIGISHDW